MKVFIADESPAVGDRLQEWLLDIKDLEISGRAGTLSETIQGIVRAQPEVVILDLRMPAGKVMIALESIKNMDLSPIVIILSNAPYPGYRERYLAAGADYFFDKSSEFDQLQELMRHLTARQGDRP
ncbi:MAG: response regulator [Desulfohalobiaceae bacterium]|nr:response regulator [Desulfohalobiaceae bacterium]